MPGTRGEGGGFCFVSFPGQNRSACAVTATIVGHLSDPFSSSDSGEIMLRNGGTNVNVRTYDSTGAGGTPPPLSGRSFDFMMICPGN